MKFSREKILRLINVTKQEKKNIGFHLYIFINTNFKNFDISEKNCEEVMIGNNIEICLI